MSDAAHDEGRVVGDEGAADEVVFHAGFPVFAEFVGFAENIPGQFGIFLLVMLFSGGRT